MSTVFSVVISTVDRDLNQHKIVVLLFGISILYYFSSTNVSIMSV